MKRHIGIGAVLVTAAFLSSSLLASPAAAIEPEKQPIFSNIQGGSLCGTHSPPSYPVRVRSRLDSA
jgi:hypothetical protein